MANGPTVRTRTSTGTNTEIEGTETLGDMARQDASAVAMTGGSESGVLRTPVEETVVGAGAVSVTKEHTSLALVGAGAVTLAAPSKPGLVKAITMTADNGDVTLALTNVQGGSAATTCTFNDVNDTLVLVAGANKWNVIKEVGVTMS